MSNDIDRLARTIEALAEFDPDGPYFWHEHLEQLEARQLLFHVAGSNNVANPDNVLMAANIPCEIAAGGVWAYTPDDQKRANDGNDDRRQMAMPAATKPHTDDSQERKRDNSRGPNMDVDRKADAHDRQDRDEPKRAVPGQQGKQGTGASQPAESRRLAPGLQHCASSTL